MASLVRWLWHSLLCPLKPCSLCPPKDQVLSLFLYCKLGRRILKDAQGVTWNQTCSFLPHCITAGLPPIEPVVVCNVVQKHARPSHLGKPALKESLPFDLFLYVSHGVTIDILMYNKQTDIPFQIASSTYFQQPECPHIILEMLRSSPKVENLFRRNDLSLFPKGVAWFFNGPRGKCHCMLTTYQFPHK